MSGANPTDFIGMNAYGTAGEKIGTIREALTEDGGKLRYFVVEVGSWFTSKEVVVPVGLARVEDDGVYFDTLSRDQVKHMNCYQLGEDYTDEQQVADIRVLKGTGYVPRSPQARPSRPPTTTPTRRSSRRLLGCSCSKSG
ncbi:PRC-barrel domain-containing protein (plasmid) [Deinococcus radiomollis]|uniref:PRC-barrel domain-containing protein n=1 Tax=Deinococcus radiomollis TaxID=468916 RepID=UPI0038924757